MKTATIRPMKTASLSEIRNRPALLRGMKTLKITDRGRTLGVFKPLPRPDESVPIEVRRRLYRKSVAKTRRQLAERGITEEQLQRDFEALRKNRRRQ